MSSVSIEHSAHRDLRGSQEPSASIIIPSYNAAETIESCLESVVAQAIAANAEVLVIDSSVDKTPEIIERRFPEVRIEHHATRLMPGEARNRGADLASGDVLVFIDADCVAAPGWLEAHLAEQRAGYKVVGGSVENAYPWNPVSVAEYFLEFREYSKWRERRPARMSPSCNLSVDKAAFLTAGRFPDLRASEDVVLAKRLSDMGLGVVITPDAEIIHRNRRALRPFLRNQAVLGAGFVHSRSAYQLPGAFLLRSPFLLVVGALVRFGRTMPIILRERAPGNLIHFIGFVASLPWQFLGLAAWAFGAVQTSKATR